MVGNSPEPTHSGFDHARVINELRHWLEREGGNQRIPQVLDLLADHTARSWASGHPSPAVDADTLRQLHRDAYRADLAASILARVPADLDLLMERVVLGAASRLGFHVEQVRGRHAYAIDFGNEAIVDSLPGVPGGSSFVGSFDREYAVEDEAIDFYSSGHALVEGLLAHFDEDARGRVARLELDVPGAPGAGVVAIYKDGPQFDVVAFDGEGNARPEWADVFRRGTAGASRMKAEDAAAHDGSAIVARVTPLLGPRAPHAVAAVIVSRP